MQRRWEGGEEGLHVFLEAPGGIVHRGRAYVLMRRSTLARGMQDEPVVLAVPVVLVVVVAPGMHDELVVLVVLVVLVARGALGMHGEPVCVLCAGCACCAWCAWCA